MHSLRSRSVLTLALYAIVLVAGLIWVRYGAKTTGSPLSGEQLQIVLIGGHRKPFAGYSDPGGRDCLEFNPVIQAHRYHYRDQVVIPVRPARGNR